MTQERLMYLLNRYLEQTATEEELQEYADWYREAGSTGPNLFDHARSAAAQEYTGSLFDAIGTHIDAAEQRQAKRGRRIVYLRWAAAAAIIVLAGSLALYHTPHTKPAAIPPLAVQTRPPAPPADTLRIATRAGESRRIGLPDGSSVQLFENSELSYCRSFGRHSRPVYLKGKGYFIVNKDGARPFTVYSGRISTTALGTSFTITAYPGHDHLQVFLHTGQVVVKQWVPAATLPIQELYLLPGQQLSCPASGGLATVRTPADANTKRPPPPGSRTGFAAAFDQASMAAVLDTMEKGYSVHIQYSSEEMANMVFSGRIRETDSLSQVLHRMSALYNLSIRPTVKAYIIRKNH